MERQLLVVIMYETLLLYAPFGTALNIYQVTLLRVVEYLRDDGTVKQDWKVREEVAYNSNEKSLFWNNKSVSSKLNS